MVVEIPPELEREIEKAAARARVSKEEIVFSVVNVDLPEKRWNSKDAMTAVDEMSKLNAPTCDIEQMLAEIEAARLADLPPDEDLY
jgi:hypothetical protein